MGADSRSLQESSWMDPQDRTMKTRTNTPKNQRELGRFGLQVSRLCFGGNVVGWTADAAA